MSIARQIARGKRAATADTRCKWSVQMAKWVIRGVVTILVQMEPRWILRDFDLAGILCPARNSTLYLRPTLVRATSGAIRSPHASLLPHALLSPCSLPAALAYLTLSFLMPSILCLSAAHRQPLWSAHSSAALAPCCQLGTRRSDSDSSKCARVSVQI